MLEVTCLCSSLSDDPWEHSSPLSSHHLPPSDAFSFLHSVSTVASDRDPSRLMGVSLGQLARVRGLGFREVE